MLAKSLQSWKQLSLTNDLLLVQLRFPLLYCIRVNYCPKNLGGVLAIKNDTTDGSTARLARTINEN